jgi:predicted HTH domain antitoxin
LDAALRQRRIDEAVKDYRDGKVTLWRASEMAGLSLRELMEIVKEQKVPVPYTLDDLDRDLEYVKRSRRGKR